MDQGSGYPVNGGQYGLDPALLNESPWSFQYGQQNEHFGAPQNAPPTTLSHQAYQQYSDSQPPYSNYGLPQESMYPMPSYSGNYPPQYQQSNPLNPYVMQQYGAGPAQASSQVEQSFPASSRSWVPYSSVFAADDRTISPSALQRVDNVPQTQRSAQAWARDAAGEFQQQNAINQTGVSSQQTSGRGNVVGYSSPNFGGAESGPIGGTSSQGSDSVKSTMPRRGIPTSRQSSLRITHPELLSSTKNVPSRRIGVAPYVVLDVEPVELEISARAKTAVPKPLKDNSSRAPIAGLENSGTLITPSAGSTKSRGRPLKSSAPTGKVIKQGDQKDTGSLDSTKSKSTDSPSSSEEGSSLEYDSSSDEQSDGEEMLEKISDVRGETRPTDVVEAAAWDAIGTFYVPSWRNASTDEIIKGTQEFGKYFLNLRDELVSLSTDLATAEAEKRLDDVRRLRDERVLKRKVISSAVQATIKFGKGSVVSSFGKSPRLINALINVLRDCVKFKDLDGEVPKAVLNLLSRCDFITDELLQKAKFEPLEKRFLMNNNAEIKGYIETIRASTVDAKDRARADEKAAKKAEDEKTRPAAQEAFRARKAEEALKSTSNPSSLKRPLDSDANTGKPNKKVASEATAVGSGQKAPPTKARAPSFFDNLKRPGLKSSVASKVANPPAPVKKPEPKPEPTSIPQSSLAEILASIEKPREVPKAPEAPPRPPETPEEKARRERKESRRHLRVHWKDGTALTEIRLFKHEQAEDEGRQDNMLRDAHDDRSEGMMLKQRILENMTDDEDEGAAEIEYRPYPELTIIDFSEINRDTREKSFVTRGGQLAVNTPQQQIQDKRESLELMVVYTDPKDIPPSPKEPPQVNNENSPMERAFGQPSVEWLVQRLREIYQYGQATAMSVSVRRLEEQRAKTRYDHTGQGISGSPDITAILNAMKGLPQNNTAQQLAYQQPASPNFTSPQDHQIRSFSSQPNTGTQVRTEQETKMANDVFANLARIADQLKGKPYPPTEPPAWMTERGKFEWWEGYHRDQTAARLQAESAETRAHQAQLRTAQAQVAKVAPAQTQTAVPQMQYPQMGSYLVPPPPNMATGVAPSYDVGQLQKVLAGLNNAPNNPIPAQLQNIFSGLNNSQNNQALPPQQQSWVGGWPSATGGANSGTSYTSQPQSSRWDNAWSNTNATDNTRPSYNENSRSTTYDTSNQDSNNHRGRDGGYSAEERHRGNNPPEYKRGKKPCKFWQEGKCAKGANCTFLHE